MQWLSFLLIDVTIIPVIAPRKITIIGGMKNRRGTPAVIMKKVVLSNMAVFAIFIAANTIIATMETFIEVNAASNF